ncbi:hypothetical protein [Mycoplasma capricolum]|uniref:hypothetical protein n=1 Tax=Mycoplasma capricolum TaxID=2095 RepID=UPI0022F3C588|nr:hypothetical protein [Mycoplasma capricolum]WBX36348.1 hypothetical protein NO343_00530 [Mycoplasma capricolum subsp. capricolum]
MKNKSNNILILIGSIISTLGSIACVCVIGYIFYVNLMIAWFFPIFFQIIKAFFNLIGLGLAITSLALSILISIPKFINNKRLILIAGILNIAFGFIVGGILLIIGQVNMTNTSVVSLTNNDTKMINSTNQETKKEKEDTIKTQKASSSLKITQPFKYKELILAGLVLTLLGSIAVIIIMTNEIIIWVENSGNKNIVFGIGLIPNLISTYTQSILSFILLLMSIFALITIKKNDILLIFIAAVSIPLFYPVFINAIGGILILAGVTIKKITEPKTKIN